MKRIILAALLLLAFTSQAKASFIISVYPSAPCSAISLGCSAAYSVMQKMVPSWTGHLFKLTRISDGSTLNVDADKNGFVNMAGVDEFCLPVAAANPYNCYFSLLYDQSGNTNDLPATGQPLYYPSVTKVYGYPIVFTTSTAYFVNNSTTGLSSGNNNISTGLFSNSSYGNYWTVDKNCCASFGQMEASVPLDGVMFAVQIQGTSGGFAAAVDFEAEGCPHGSAYPLSTSYGNALITASYDNSVGSPGTTTTYVNGVKQTTCVPNVTLNHGLYIKLGEAGDNTKIPMTFISGFMVNGKMTDTEQSNVWSLINNMASRYPTGCSGLGDTFGLTMKNAWSVRSVFGDFVGPVLQLVRKSDSSTIDVYPGETCNLDLNTVNEWCQGTTCKVSTLHNQAISSLGTGTQAQVDSTQGTDANRPALYPNCMNGHFCVAYNGTTQVLNASANYAVAPFSVAFAAERINIPQTGVSGSAVFSSNDTAPDIGFNTTANQAFTAACGTGIALTSVTDNAVQSVVGTYTGAGGNLYAKGSIASGGSSCSNMSTNMGIGYDQSATNQALYGYVGEVLVFNAALNSTQVGTIRTNHQSYFGAQ